MPHDKVVGSQFSPPHTFVHATHSALADPYPEAKREACTALGLVARHAPAQLRLHQARLLKPLLGLLGHQHARIRSQGLQALGGLVGAGHDAMGVLMEEHVLPVLRRLVFDRTPSVRRELGRVVGAWLGQAGGPYFFEVRCPYVRLSACLSSPRSVLLHPLIIHIHMYIHQACEPQLLLLLLLLLSDESPGDVATEARQQAMVAGQAWVARQRAWRGRPRLDVIQPEAPKGGDAMELDAADAEEEGEEDEDEAAGLRRMVRALFARSLLPRALDDVGHWTLRMRHRAILLLADLVSLAGQGQEDRGPVLASLPVIVATLLSTLVADGAEAEVAAAVEQAARALAQAVPPAALLDELLPQVRGERGAQAAHRGAALRLLQPCLLLLLPAPATPTASSRPLTEQEAAAVARALADPGLMEDAGAVAGPLAGALSAAAACLPSSCQRELIRAAVPLLALPADVAPRAQALEALAALAASRGHGGEDEGDGEEGPVPRLLHAHFEALLADATAGAEAWDSPQAPGRVVLDVLLRECPRGAAEHWGVVGPVLAGQLQAPPPPSSSDAGGDDGRGAELRLAHLLLLGALLRDLSFRASLAAPEAAQHIAAGLLQPNLVWRAGRAEATVRKAALMALHALLRGGSQAAASSSSCRVGPALRALLLPSLGTALEESDATARELAALCVKGVLIASAAEGGRGDDDGDDAEGGGVVARVLPDLLKRLDDPSEDVRRATCQALRALAPLLLGEKRGELEKRLREEEEEQGA